EQSTDRNARRHYPRAQRWAREGRNLCDPFTSSWTKSVDLICADLCQPVGSGILIDYGSCWSNFFQREQASSRAFRSASRTAGLVVPPERMKPWPAPL